MKRGDLVRHKRHKWIGVVTETVGVETVFVAWMQGYLSSRPPHPYYTEVLEVLDG